MEFIIEKSVLLKKFPGKAAWTYIDTPEIKPDPHSPFGWVRVKGFIDDLEFENLKLMPKGDGKLFMPVNARIRKAIKKESGDTVFLKLSLQSEGNKIPQEILDCLELESEMILKKFLRLTEFNQKIKVDHIYNAKEDHIRIQRINELIDELRLE